MNIHNENTMQRIRAENYFIRRTVYIGNNDSGGIICYIEDY